MNVDEFDDPRRFVFLLLHNFSFISFASAIEPLRLANRAKEKHCTNGCLYPKTGCRFNVPTEP